MKKITLSLFFTLGLFAFSNAQVVFNENNESPAMVGDAANTLGYQTSGGSATVQLGTKTGLNTGGNQVIYAVHSAGDLYVRSKNLPVSPGDVFDVEFDVSSTNGVTVVTMRYTTDDITVFMSAFQPDSPVTSTNGVTGAANGRVTENTIGTATHTTARFTAPAFTESASYNNCRVQVYNSGISNTFELDNMIITKTPALSIDDLSKFSFNSYPNPAKDRLSQSASKSIDKIEIYNLLGQQVIVKALNSSKSEVNVANLSKGIYVARVFIEDAVGSYKFIKD